MGDYFENVQNSKREKVFDLIDGSSELTFAWNQKRDFVGHTGVVLIFDSEPIFTFDFGPSLAYCGSGAGYLVGLNKSTQMTSASLQSPVQSGVSINVFDATESMVKGAIVKVQIWKKRQKEKAKRAVAGLLRIGMGDYTFLGNNCREFVKKAKEFLDSFWEDDDDFSDNENNHEIQSWKQHNFEKEMNQVQTVDNLKVAAVGGGIVLGVGAIAWGISKLLEPNSREKNSTNRS